MCIRDSLRKGGLWNRNRPLKPKTVKYMRMTTFIRLEGAGFICLKSSGRMKDEVDKSLYISSVTLEIGK